MTEPSQPAPFDRTAARARYRALMRGRLMRSMYVVLAIVLLAAWGLGIASIVAKDVERLPGHDLGVGPTRCITCHTQPGGAPAMPHVAFPSCGFCHRQT
jgi:hypothetical protein